MFKKKEKISSRAILIFNKEQNFVTGFPLEDFIFKKVLEEDFFELLSLTSGRCKNTKSSRAMFQDFHSG